MFVEIEMFNSLTQVIASYLKIVSKELIIIILLHGSIAEIELFLQMESQVV
jgi:hypothetical protein